MPGQCGHCRRTIPEVVSYCPYCGTCYDSKPAAAFSPLVIALAGVLVLLVGMVAWQLMLNPR